MKLSIIFLVVSSALFAQVNAPQGPPSFRQITPSTGTGTGPVTFQVQAQDTQINPNAANLTSIELWLATTSGYVDAPSCHAIYYMYYNVMGVYDASGNIRWMTPGSGDSQNGGNCTLSTVGAHFTNEGGGIGSAYFPINFSSTFSGGHYPYVWVNANTPQGPQWSGWIHQNNAIWTVPAGGSIPTVSLLSPAMGGSGSFARFTISATGTSQQWTSLQISPGGSGWPGWSIAHSCVLLMYTNGDVYMGNDNFSGFSGPARTGVPGAILSNTQCTLNVETSQFTPGNPNIWYLDISFTQNFLGTKTVMGLASNSSGTYAANPTTFGSWMINQTNIDITPLHALPGILTTDDTDGVTQVPVPSSNDQFMMVNLHGGRQHKVYRADKVTIKKFESSRQPVGDGWTYNYKISCPNCMLFRIGTTEDGAMFDDSKLSANTKAWISADSFWSTNPDTGIYPADNDEFVIESKWLPGLMPMYFVNHEAEKNYALPFTGRDASTILAASNIFVNSKLKFVIGPAIKPGSTRDELLAMVDRWANDYGFSWLQSLIEAKSMDGLDALAVPEDDLSRDIVKCLKEVIVKQ